MCPEGASFLLVLALTVCIGLCQNAEPGRHFNDFRNPPADAELEGRRDDYWEPGPEGARATESEEAAVAGAAAEERPTFGRATGNEDDASAVELGTSSHGKSSAAELQAQRASNASTRLKAPDAFLAMRSDARQLQAERRRKKRRRSKQQQPWRSSDEENDNLVNVGGRLRAKKKPSPSELATLPSQSGKKSRSRAGKFREERRRRRRNRKRTRSRLRLENRYEERKWRDNPIVRLMKILSEQKLDEARLLSENPLNLSTTRFSTDRETTRVLELQNGSSAYSPAPTTEPRIPEPPEPTSRLGMQPGDVEREFSRQVEREYSRVQQAEKSAAGRSDESEDGDESEEVDTSEEEETPRFDERYAQVAKQADLSSAAFDPERMLGYSRTDEDLPILDMENEVLQRTLKDYNAYMSSSFAKTARTAKPAQEQRHYSQNERRRFRPDSASSTEASEEDESSGDLSCINGTFVPAPFVPHAVIKYVKSSSPGQEYLEADYECEPGYSMSSGNNSSRLLCRERRWIGRLPVCKYRDDNEATCAKLGCEQLCRIVAGRAECLCREGYRLESRKCIDIDECLANEGRGPCEDTCRNVAGGYFCSCEGRAGSSLAPDNRTCQESQTSSSAIASDAGLCNYDNAGCSHTCLASMGRVFCLCPDGFMLEDDWKTCQDVDECAVPDLQTEVCRYGCINTPGSYRCAQPPPQLAEERERLLRQEIAAMRSDCQPGYEPTATKSCIDVNECAVNNGGCSEVCENTEGTFFCACEGDERILSADRRTCVVAEKRFETMDREAEALSVRYRSPSDVSCSALNPVGRGQLICSDSEQALTTEDYEASNKSEEDEEEEEANEEERDNEEEAAGETRERKKPGTKCHLRCPRGYELHGEYELTCRADGTWDGPKHGECLRYSKPRLDCPRDVVAELPPGRDEAFVTYDQPSTDLDWFRYVRSKPSWGTRLEANLKKGIHEITFYARHPVSKKQASCTLKITVEEGQAPKVKGCPSDIEITGRNGSAITWVEPIFTDNVKVTRVTSNESPGRTFSVGGHKIEYEAADEAGWTTKCIFTVVLRPVNE